MRDRSQVIEQKDLRVAAESLATDIANNPRWKKFKEESLKKGQADVVILLNEFTNLTGDPFMKVKTFEEFYPELGQALTDRDVAMLAQSVDPTKPNHWEGAGRAQKQDSDDRYNQQSSDVLSADMDKTPVVLKIEINKTEVPVNGSGRDFVEYTMRARLLDARRGVEFVNKKYPFTKSS